MAVLRSLAHRPFALLWSGQTTSRLGDHVYRIALAWWVLEKTDSAVAMGAVQIFSAVPMLLFLLPGGVAVDRFSRPKAMLVSDLLRGAVVAVVALLAFGQLLEVWHIYLASVVFGLVAALFHPAYTATVPEITPRELLPSANSLTSLSDEVTGVAGPALGAGIMSLGGAPLAFALDAVSFLISAACLAPLCRLITPPDTSEPRPSSAFQDLHAGISAVLASRWLWVTIAIAALANMMQHGAFTVALPFLIKNHLRQNVGALGLVYSMFSLGSVIAAVWLGRLPRIRRRGLIAYTAWAVGGLMTLTYGLPVGLTGVASAALVAGAMASVFNLVWLNTLQELIPSDMLGRIASVDFLGSAALLPVGYGMAGWATELVGAPLVFVIGGAATLGLALVGLTQPAIRKLD